MSRPAISRSRATTRSEHGTTRAARRLARLSMTIIGAGRAGSFTALAAGMIGVGQVQVYDHDSLDPERNLAVQFYPASAVRDRRPKPAALGETLNQFVPDLTVVPRHEAFEGRRGQQLDPIVLVAVDTMATRAALAKTIFRRRSVDLLLDLRLGGSVMRLLTVPMHDKPRWYRKTLYGDDETWGAACADSPDPQVALGAAAFVAGAVLNHLRGGAFPRILSVDFRSAATLVEKHDSF